MRIRPLILLTLTCALFSRSATAQTVFHEDFRNTVSSAWTIIGRDTSFYTLNAAELDLRVSRQDIDTGWDNHAKNLFLIPNPATGDFSATLKLNSFVPASANHAQIDVIAFDDEDNLIRANYGFIKGQPQAEFGAEIAAGWSPEQTPLDMADHSFYLRLTKTGATYTQSWSVDGVNFTTINSPRHFGNGTPAYLGFCAGADPTDSSHVHIASFTVESTSATPLSLAKHNLAPPPATIQTPSFKYIVHGGNVITPTVTPAAAPSETLHPDSNLTLSIASAVQIAWPTVPGKTYLIQTATDLTSPVWTDFGQPMLATSTNLAVFDVTSGGNQKYYRALASP